MWPHEVYTFLLLQVSSSVSPPLPVPLALRMQYFLDAQAWVEKIPDDSECRTTLHRQACADLQDFMNIPDSLCLFWKIALLPTYYPGDCDSAPAWIFLAKSAHQSGTWNIAELLLLLSVLLTGIFSCRWEGSNITKIAVTLLVIVVLVPDTGEEGAGICLSDPLYNSAFILKGIKWKKILCLQSCLIAAVIVTVH